MKRNTILKHLFSLLSGLFAALPLVFDGIPYLSFLLFTPYFLFLLLQKDTVRLGFYYLSGLFFFLGYYMAAFSFFGAMYPLDFAGLGRGESIAVLFAAMVLLPLFQAWFSAFSVLFLGLFKRKGALRFPLAFSLTLAALFTLFSYAQNFTWAGVPWANTAVGLASSPILLQSASILGSSFLVFLTLFCNAALAEGYVAFRQCLDKQAFLCVITAIALFASNLLFGVLRVASHEDAKDTLTVAVLQGCAPATENTYMKSYNKFLKTNIDLARANDWLLPKGTGFFPLPYKLSQGSLPVVSASWANDLGAVKLTIPHVATAAATVGDFSQDMIAAGYQAGDIVTVICVAGANANANFIPINYQFALDTTSTTTLVSLQKMEIGLTFDSDTSSWVLSSANDDLGAGAVIVARFENEKWRRSTQVLVVKDSIISAIAESTYRDAAIASYGPNAGDPNPLVYLDGDTLEG